MSINVHGYEVFNGKYVHRIIAAKALGRELTGTENVHHVDTLRSNNENSNLVICPDMEYHMLLHARQKILDLGGQPDRHKYCSYHECLHERQEFSTRPSSYDGLHNNCRAATNEYRRTKGLNRDKFDWKARLHQQYRRAFKSLKIQISPWEVCP